MEVDAWKRQGEEAEEGKKSDESEGLEYAPMVWQVGNEPNFDFDLFTRSSIDLLDDLVTWTKEMMRKPEDNDWALTRLGQYRLIRWFRGIQQFGWIIYK